MILSRYNLKNINPSSVNIPAEDLFELPEKVLQFGTGVLLRGLPDYFIDKANRQGIFNGRIVVVKSTSHGDTAAFDRQDSMFTQCVRGVLNGKNIQENIVNASISRVLNANDHWQQVLECAHNQQMQVIISNTTEVGIVLENDNIKLHPPKSFPGKLLAFLYERYQAFGGSERSGMVIIPTELIPDNGTKLQGIVLELAHLNSLEDAFIEWLECCNHFCNSLVDRIVPGQPAKAQKEQMEQELGYTDELLTVSEVYRLWAIEGNDDVRAVLAFARADEGVVIEPNIDRYRELKLRLLNGTHTMSCGLAFLAGCGNVKTAMDDETVAPFIRDVMLNEIAPAIPYELDAAVAADFGNKVLDRFRNPHIDHAWINITMNYSSKLKLRILPVLLKHYEQHHSVPALLSLGFAGYLLFMKGVAGKDGKYTGSSNEIAYPIQDEQAEVFYRRWAGLSTAALVRETLGDVMYWGTDLNNLPGFTDSVTEDLSELLSEGVRETMEAKQYKKEGVA